LGAVYRTIGKWRELLSETVFGTSRGLANPSLEIEDLFHRCSVQKQNTTSMLIVKIPYFSKLFSRQSRMSNGDKAGRVAQVFGVQLWSKFLWEQFYFCFLLTTVHFIQISVFAFLYGVSDIFMSVFQMELNDYPHFDLTKDRTLCSTG
jgi:hypothetical protein